MMKPWAREYVLKLLDGSASAEYEVNLSKMKVFEKKVTESKAHKFSACHPWMCWERKQEKQMA